MTSIPPRPRTTESFTAKDSLAAAIRRSIVTGQETPGQMAERILADPEYRAEAAAIPAQDSRLDTEGLAKRILTSFWWSRRQGLQRADGSWEPDESSCSMCDKHGGYSEYDVDWHDAECPVRWACEVLGTTDALGKANDLRDELFPDD